MLIAIFGESCTGKSYLADRLTEKLEAQVISGKDYLRLAKSESEAKRLFAENMQAALTGAHLIYVTAEPEQLALVPAGAYRVLVTAELAVICERFAARMRGVLPPPVAAMLEKKHGCFDAAPHDLHIVSGETDIETAVAQILTAAK